MKLAAFAISTVLIAAAAWAGWNDTSTGIDLTSLPAFPLTKVRSGLLKEGEEVRFDGFVAQTVDPTYGPPEVVLSGAAKSGKGWSVHFGLVAFDNVYRADLDGNRTQDYVVLGRTPYCCGRLLPPWRLAVLLIDSQGLPVPFEGSLYDDLGPRHVVDVLHSGRAQLALGSYDENPWDNRAGFGCSGHWVTDLYEPTDFNWEGFRGSAAGSTFPFVHGWTLGPECNPPGPSQSYKPSIRTGQYSTASEDITSARLEKSDAGWAELAPTSGCEGFGVGTIVYDQPSRREIALASNSDYRGDLMERILADKAEVTLRGVQHKPDSRFCTANLLWANK